MSNQVQNSSAIGANVAEPVAVTAIPRFSWAYFHNGLTYAGLVLALLNAFPMSHILGAWIIIPWLVTSMGIMLAVVTFKARVALGEAAAAGWVRLFEAIEVTVWMASATAFFLSGNPMGALLSIAIPWGWSVHLIFSAQAHLKATLGMLAACAVPMLGFMIYTAFLSLPVWVAIGSCLSGVAMVVGIASSARRSTLNFRRLQAALSEAAATRERMEFAIQNASDGYFEIDLATMAYSPNAALEMTLGSLSGTSDAKTLKEHIHPDDQALAFGSLAKAQSGEIRSLRNEVRVRVASGDWRWMQVRGQVIEANALHGRKLLGTVVDMTAWKTIEAELRAAKESAEASSKTKSEFLANMSHEIRTPLNGVLGMAQALEADGLNDAQREKVNVILDSGKSLMALLNDVLDLSKIEAGKLEISPVPGDFLHTIKRTRQLFQAQAEEKGVELFVRYDAHFPQRLSYDPVRVRQCVSNLFSNAIKFTAKGRVEAAISAKSLGDGAHMVSVEVSDTGIGMTQEVIGRLFTVFTQADNSTTRRFGGSGLGLSISRELARMMGGDIVAISEEGRGSTFTLTFRAQESLAESEAAPQAAEQPAMAAAGALAGGIEPPKRTLRGARVLLTDDNAINRQVIKLFIAPLGCEIQEATNGKEALDKIASQPFDIVLLDVHMPVMDGKETIQRIRAASQAWKDIPVIALTADAMSGDREKYIALGMSDYVSKPVDQRELVAKMLKVMGLDVVQRVEAKRA